jgi:hypothetical protein
MVDALTLRSGADLNEDVAAGRGELVRSVAILHGKVSLRVDVEPRGGGHAESYRGVRIGCPSRPDIELQLSSAGRPLRGVKNLLELTRLRGFAGFKSSK